MLKIVITGFSRRFINLNLLNYYYLLNKDYKFRYFNLIYIARSIKLFNILKSPIQYKTARTQIGFIFNKAIMSIRIYNSYFKSNFIVNVLLFNFFFIGVKKILFSNCAYLIEKKLNYI